MIIPDINLLVYAYSEESPQHAKAKDWWERALNSDMPVGLPWIVAAGFIRVITHPRIFVKPMAVTSAVGIVREWLAADPVIVISPGERFAGLFLECLEKLGVGGNLTTDAQLAAFAVENQAVLFSNDTDFARFDGLRVRNPLK